jgi:hypothetical protein
MLRRQPAAIFIALAISPLLTGNGSAQSVLRLNRANNGQIVTASVGQQIDIVLNTIGPGNYDVPQLSCSAVRFERFGLTRLQNPGGPTQEYHFRAAAEGEAQIQIAHTQFPGIPPTSAFAVTIQVGSTAGCPAALRPKFVVDQANTEPWKKAATNLVNDVEQSFTPSLPTLAAVEVQLVVINPGLPEDSVQMALFNESGEPLAIVSRTVPVSDCSHVLFNLGGLEVSPGKLYRIQLRGGNIFGWKYVVGGYPNGAAWFNGRPLLRGTRSTFLFRTFGGN